MTSAQTVLLLSPPAYLLGSVPFGLLVGKMHGIDVRASGSGNIGATNVGRLLGKRYFFLVFLLDLLKGMLPMLAAAVVLHDEPKTAGVYMLWLLVGFSAILGHLFSAFLKFKGGKGVATSAGVMLGLFPYYTIPGLIAVGVWIALFKATRYISVASIFGAAAFPVIYLVVALTRHWSPFGEQLPLLVFAVLVALLIVVKHRTNIARLRAGTENRFVSKSD